MARNTFNCRGASEKPRSFADSRKPKSSRIDFPQIKPDTRVFHFDPNPLSNLRHPDANLITTTMAVGVPERLLDDTEDRRLQWWSQPMESHPIPTLRGPRRERDSTGSRLLKHELPYARFPNYCYSHTPVRS